VQWILVFVGVTLAIVAIFALQNPAVVTLRFLNLSTEASVLVVVLLAFAAGVFAGILALLPSSIRKSGRLRKAASELRSLQKSEEARAGRTGSASTRTPAPVAGVPPVAPGESARADRADVSVTWPERAAEPGEAASPSAEPPIQESETPKPRGLGGFFR
jgi:uncharacterized integral membrane protein